MFYFDRFPLSLIPGNPLDHHTMLKAHCGQNILRPAQDKPAAALVQTPEITNSRNIQIKEQLLSSSCQATQ